MQRFYVPLLLALSLGIALTAAQTGSPSVSATDSERFGTYLTDSEGRSLYLFTKDTRGEPSTCYDKCAENWPPLIVEEAPAAGEGVAASLLGTVERDDGSLQATYFGWPLYYFAKDEASGDTNGQGVGDVWFLVSPYGEAIETVAETAEESEGGVPAAAEGVDTDEVTQESDSEAEPADEGGKPAAAQGVDTDEVTQDGGDETISDDVLTQGRNVYRGNCAACHGAEGGGGSGPTLAANDKLQNEERILRQILKGGSFMPPFGGQLSDEEVAAVATHIRNSWDNDFGLTTPEEVKQAR